MNFTYITDYNLKEKLIHKGYKLINEINNASQNMWVFENIPPTEFDINEKSKHFNLNKMMI